LALLLWTDAKQCVGKNRWALADPSYGVKRERIGLKKRHQEAEKSSDRIHGKRTCGNGVFLSIS
jgi:hypothetical protein